MTLDVQTPDLATYDAELDSHLALAADAQQLLFSGAATANAFAPEPVSDAQMQAIHDLVKWAPTAMNVQPLRIVLVRSADARRRLVPLMAEGNRPKTAAAPLVAILAADTDFHEEMDRTFPHAPAAREMFAGNAAARESTAALNAHLQAAYFLLGVRAAGLAAGPMGGFDADAVSREFFPGGVHRAFLVVNLGHPTDESYRPRLPRLDYAEVVTTV
ncbi:MAG: malonic semialdehyde reductase [Propionibacteriaceae bacterium]